MENIEKCKKNNKLTDTEIVKALELYQKDIGCAKCDYEDEDLLVVISNALDLINRQKAEIERLSISHFQFISDINAYKEKLKTAKAEAVKEFANEIFELFPADKSNTVISRVTVKHLLKELVGDEK